MTILCMCAMSKTALVVLGWVIQAASSLRRKVSPNRSYAHTLYCVMMKDPRQQ